MRKMNDLDNMNPVPILSSPPILQDLRRLIEETRQGVAATVNAALTLLYWRIGKRISEEILKGERAEYGQRILSTISQELIRDYGSSFGENNLRRMIQFAEVYLDEKILVSLIRELSWTHFIALIPLERPLQRDFYAEMCRIERWSVRTLRKKIASMLYERTAISKNPEELARIEMDALHNEDKLTPVSGLSRSLFSRFSRAYWCISGKGFGGRYSASNGSIHPGAWSRIYFCCAPEADHFRWR